MVPPILYTQSGCVESARVRAWLEQHGIAFVERNVTDDSTAMAELAQQKLFATPLLVVGEQELFGFRPAALEAIFPRFIDEIT